MRLLATRHNLVVLVCLLPRSFIHCALGLKRVLSCVRCVRATRDQATNYVVGGDEESRGVVKPALGESWGMTSATRLYVHRQASSMQSGADGTISALYYAALVKSSRQVTRTHTRTHAHAHATHISSQQSGRSARATGCGSVSTARGWLLCRTKAPTSISSAWTMTTQRPLEA